MMRQAITLRYPVVKSIYDALMACFSSHLEQAQQKMIETMIFKLFEIKTLPRLSATVLTQSPDSDYVSIGDFIIKKGIQAPVNFKESDFILTNSFNNLVNRLASIVAVSDYAVILEGPTSAGKTSTVQYLANVTHNKVTRINNHMHTDI